jgi:pyridoxine 4-dehydrogenase
LAADSWEDHVSELLRGARLTWIGRTLDMVELIFVREERPDEKIVVHAQCPVRLRHEDSILLGSGDLNSSQTKTGENMYGARAVQFNGALEDKAARVESGRLRPPRWREHVSGAERRVILGLHRSDHSRRLLEAALTAGIRAIDTASNYRDFAAHRTLASEASDLLRDFTVSTKVGFFRTASGVEHSLDPRRLRQAITSALGELNRVPDVVLLHSPERSLGAAEPAGDYDRFAVACAVIAEAVAAGLCGSWGISCWDSRPLARLLLSAADGPGTLPRPDVLMVRSGLAVSADGLDAAERVAALLGVPPDGRWGMSPFAGDAADPAWQRIRPGTFLRPGQQAVTMPVLFRLAFELPQVARVAVGSTSAEHLRALAAAVDLEVDSEQVERYRQLLAARAHASSVLRSSSTSARAGSSSGPE